MRTVVGEGIGEGVLVAAGDLGVCDLVAVGDQVGIAVLVAGGLASCVDAFVAEGVGEGASTPTARPSRSVRYS